MLLAEGVCFSYGDVPILRDVSLELSEGEAVCLIGANGAGKSTLAYVLSGVLRPSAGSIEFNGTRLDGLVSHRVVARGLTCVPEGRRLFRLQTVRQNLELGAYHRPRGESLASDLALVFELFPVLSQRQDQIASTLSGGEQQMLAIGRALMARPKLLILDEPSVGLAPIVIAELGRTLRELKASGLSILLIEQNAELALAITDRGYVMETGRIVLGAASSRLRVDPTVRRVYLGRLGPSGSTRGADTASDRQVPAWLREAQEISAPQ